MIVLVLFLVSDSPAELGTPVRDEQRAEEDNGEEGEIVSTSPSPEKIPTGKCYMDMEGYGGSPREKTPERGRIESRKSDRCV